MLLNRPQESAEGEEKAATAAEEKEGGARRIDCADKAAYEKVVDSLRDAEWSCGSGVAKEMALEAAQARVTALERKVAMLEEEKDHYHGKAREYKAKMVAAQQQQPKIPGKQPTQTAKKAEGAAAEAAPPRPEFKENADPNAAAAATPSLSARAKKPFSRLLTLSAKKRAPKKRVPTAEEEEAAKNFKLDFKFGRP